jgi:hypothetical protein
MRLSILVNLSETHLVYNRSGKNEGGTKRDGKKGREKKVKKKEIEIEIETNKKRKINRNTNTNKHK